MEGPADARAVTRRAVLGGLAAGAVGAVTACTPAPTPSTPDASSAGSTQAGARPTSSTTATPTGPRLPLVLAAHATRAAGLGASRAVFDAAAAGGRVAWSDVGGTGDVLDVVRGA